MKFGVRPSLLGGSCCSFALANSRVEEDRNDRLFGAAVDKSLADPRILTAKCDSQDGGGAWPRALSTNIGSDLAGRDATGHRQIREWADCQFEVPLLTAGRSPTAHEPTACTRATMGG